MRRRRIDRATAASLLGGRGEASSHERLDSVLSAASAPPREHELAGEELAAAAFQRSRSEPGVAVALPRRRLAVVKVAVAVLAGVSVGGVALAGTGILPGPRDVGPVAPPATSAPVEPGRPGMSSRTEQGVVPEPTVEATPPERARTPGPKPPRPPEPRPTSTGMPAPTRPPIPTSMPTSLPVPTRLPLPTSVPTLPVPPQWP